MPALKPTSFSAEVIWLGSVFRDDLPTLWADSCEALDLGFGGVAGTRHAGTTRASCVRVTAQYPKGTRIHNERQLSILSAEELDAIAAKMGVDAIDPARMGASIVLRGIPDFSHVPPASRLQGPSGVTLSIDMENRPCLLPARAIEADAPGKGKGFKAAAEGKRGVTAFVAAEGTLRLGDTLRLHIPDQPVWAHLEAARASAT